MSDNNRTAYQNNAFVYDENAPVVITQEEAAKSEANRAKKSRTFRQLQVVRDASNLAFVIAQIEVSCPRKFRCLTDELERLSSELLQTLDLSNENMMDRWTLCNEAHSCVMTLVIKLEIIQRLCGTNKDTVKKTKKLCEGLLRQITGWRNSAGNQGSVM